MSNKIIQDKMHMLATNLIQIRYPIGWGGVAVIRTDKDSYFTGVALETANGSAQLCIEVGAMCEAHKFNEKVTHCICVTRDDENSPFKILSPCGICQERLRFWGTDVLVGITDNALTPTFVALSELQPYHWTDAYSKDDLEHFLETGSSTHL